MLKDTSLRLAARLKILLADKKWPVFVTFLACVMVLGALSTGLQYDDYVHYAKILRPDLVPEKQNHLLQLFSFADGNVTENERKINNGYFPWWALDELKISFFRPLAALTHWLDYKIWPASAKLTDVADSAVIMHIHSIIWFAAMVVAASLLYRRIITPLWIAGLAAFLFAINDAHAVPVAWLANRNALMAAAFGFSSIYFHDRWRRDSWKIGALLAPFFLLLSLFSAEAGIAICGYLLSYELFLVSGNWKNRSAGFLPYFLVAVLWWEVYHGLEFGTYGSGAYIDPGHNPLDFIKHLFERLPVLLYGQWLFPDVLFYGYLPKPEAYFALVAILISLSVLAVFLLPVIKQSPVARFWALGMLLSLLPACATVPSNRLLTFAGLGGMGLLALSLGFWIENKPWLPASRIWRVAAAWVVVQMAVVHLVLSPYSLVMKTKSMKNYTEKTLESPLIKLSRLADFSKKTLVFINPPIPFTIAFIPFFCEIHDLPMPEGVYFFVSGLSPRITIKRKDEVTLEVAPENGFIVNVYDQLYRDAGHPMDVGQTVEMAAMQATVLSLTADKRPLRGRFTFSKPLEDDSLLFFAWRDNQFVPFNLPEKGKEVSLSIKVTLEMFGL